MRPLSGRGLLRFNALVSFDLKDEPERCLSTAWTYIRGDGPLLTLFYFPLRRAGHVHAFERSVQVLDNRPDACGAVHIVIGDGGNREGLANDYLEQPAWSAMREASYGHGTLDFESATTAVFRWHRNQVQSKSKVSIASMGSSSFVHPCWL